LDFKTTEKEETFRQEVREFFDKEFPPEFLQDVEAEPEEERKLYNECVRRLAGKGWLGIGWPREYGGMECSVTQQLIYYIEMYLRLQPKVINPVGVATALAAPVIMKFGSEELKKEYLPKILKGQATFCLGYSEPAAGSDLVGLQTSAVAEGNEYVINGQKAFTTAAEYAGFCWLSAKTDTKVAKRSRGISLFIVDMKSPGIAVQPVPTMSKFRVNNVSLNNVRVPKRNRVGEENQGWTYITQALSQERLGFGVQAAILKHTFDELMQYARETYHNSKPLYKEPIVRDKLARLAIELEVAQLLAARVVWMLEGGVVAYHQASIAKVFVTELEQRLVNVGMQILGLHGQLRKGSKWAPLEGKIEDAYRHSVMATIGGGSTEVQRMIIAIAGLGLPRS